MKLKTLIVLIILFLLIFLPFSIAFFMEVEILYFASGNIDSWILFWGSYVGAIIGSLVVYIVANFQLKKQHEQQISDVKNESILLYHRDIDGYFLKNKLDKLDSMFELTNQLLYKLEEVHSFFQEFCELLYLNDKEELKHIYPNITEEVYWDKINILKENTQNNHSQVHSIYRKLRTSASYVPEMSDNLNKIDTELMNFSREINFMLNHNEYKQYMDKTKDSQVIFNTPSLLVLFQMLPNFIKHGLQKELSNSLSHIKVLAGEVPILTKNDNT